MVIKSNDEQEKKELVSQKVKEMLLDIYKAESEACSFYLKMQYSFESLGYHKFACYFAYRAQLKKCQKQWIIEYLQSLHESITLPAFDELTLDIVTIDDVDKDFTPFMNSINDETAIVDKIYNLIDQVADEGDWRTFNWIQGTLNDTHHLLKKALYEQALSMEAKIITQLKTGLPDMGKNLKRLITKGFGIYKVE